MPVLAIKSGKHLIIGSCHVYRTSEHSKERMMILRLLLDHYRMQEANSEMLRAAEETDRG